MLTVATDYYKDLFKWEARPDIRLDQDFFTSEEKVTSEENDSLDCRFTLDEIREAVFGSYADGAPGPDGLSFMFYLHFWDIIKFDLLEMFDDWFENRLDIYRLNFSMTNLIPKEEDGISMKKFRPISLCNCSFKIFTKAITNRYARIMNRLISQCQFAFVRGRFILESVVTAHEVIHEIHSKKEQGLIFKIDYEKAYDMVNLDFLYEVLSFRGFSDKFIHMIRQITQKGSVGVKVNEVEGEFFLTGKGLRQGDPLAPLLFNTVVDVFSRMLVKGSNAGLVRGLCSNLILRGVISLQYADDTLLFLEKNREVAINFKWILTCFEQLSGMRINYHKSELIGINVDNMEMSPFLEIFQCVEGQFPIKYLGLPLHFKKLKREELQSLVDSLLKRLSGWRGKLLSLEARRLLIRTVLASIPIYMLSFFKFPKWALKLINTQLSNCLWSDEEGNRKIHLANWRSIL
jgi:hypothetical protein